MKSHEINFIHFLSRIGTFLRSELKSSTLLVQSSHHGVTGAQLLISLNKLLWYIHVIMHNSAVSYIINRLCCVD